MYHYFEAITNTKGDALIGYYIRAIDPTTGSGVALFADESMTPIISVSGTADAAVVDSDGNASFWITGGTYHLDIYATNGTSFVRRIESIPMVDFTTAFASVKDYGAVGDGAADDTAAFVAAFADARKVRWPAGRYLVSAIEIPADTVVETDGFSTIIEQQLGTADTTRIISFVGSNIRLGDIAVTGQIADNSDEQNPAIFIAATATTGPLQNITIGNVQATDIRGDAVYIGSIAPDLGAATITIASPGVVTNAAHGLAADTEVRFTTTGALPTGLAASTSYYVRNPTTNTFELALTPGGSSINTSGSQSGTHTLRDVHYKIKQVSVGHIYADNCWRNGLSVTDGVFGLDVASVVEGACGQHTVDIEPDSNIGIHGVRIGYVRGRHVQASGSLIMVDGFIENADLDLSFGSNSTPANPVDHKAASQVSGTDNAVVVQGAVLTFGRLKANGYTGQAITQTSLGAGTSKVFCGSAEITNCCTSDTVYSSYFEGAAEYRIDELTATTTLAAHRVFGDCVNAQVGKATIALASSSSYMRSCTDCRTDDLVVTIADGGVGGLVLLGCTRCSVNGGTQTSDKFFNSCTDCAVRDSNATATTFDASGTNNSAWSSVLNGNFSYFYNIAVGSAFSTTGRLSAVAFPALTGDVTTVAGALATTVAANVITYAKFQQVAASSLVGNATGSLANATGITLAGGLAFSGSTLTAAGALTPTSVAIGSGTALTKAVVYTPSITPASVAAATVAEQTFTVTGLTTADKVMVNPPSISNSTGVAGVRVSAADTLAIRFTNPTAGALTPTSGTYTVIALRS